MIFNLTNEHINLLFIFNHNTIHHLFKGTFLNILSIIYSKFYNSDKYLEEINNK